MKSSLKFTVLLLLVAISLTTSTRSYADDERRDGNWWITLDKQYKHSYFVGFFDGMDLGQQFSVWNFVNNPADRPCVKKVVDSCGTYHEKYLKGITNVHLSDGMDEFYKDYKNRRILVSDAVWLVLNGIAGKPEAELNKMIENFRKNATRQ